MKHAFAAIITAIILASCASYADRQAQEPRLVVTSTKPQSDYVACIMPKARERWGGMVTVGPDGDAQVLMVEPNSTGVLMTLTVEPDGQGSRISYRSASRIGFFGQFQDDIAACV